MNLRPSIKTFEQKKKDFEKVTQLLSKLSGSRKTLQSLIGTEHKKIEGIDSSLEKYQQTVQLLQLVAERAQSQIVKVEKICSDALRDILANPDITFKFKSERKRNLLETKFYIQDKKVGETDLMHGEAGGVKNVVAIGLRLVFTELYNPKIEGPAILDETGGNISAEYQESFGKFLKKFSTLTGRQIILVSHHTPVIAEASRRIAVSNPDGESIALVQS